MALGRCLAATAGEEPPPQRSPGRLEALADGPSERVAARWVEAPERQG